MNKFEERRNKLGSLLPNESVTYIFSGDKVMFANDEAYPFYCDRNFLYLTGIEEEGAILRIFKNKQGVLSTKLFILPYDEQMAKWVGGRIRKEEAINISSINSVSDISDLYDDVADMYRYGRDCDNFIFYVDTYFYESVQDEKAGYKFAKNLVSKYPSINLKDLYPLMKKIRLIKNDDEIEDIKKAIKITNQGILSMMKNIKPNMNERVVEATFDWVLAHNLSSQSFEAICASGKRATILHYSDNNQMVLDGELFLCDLGARYNHYQADISRTFPVNGKFSPRQKEIYEIVLKAQNIVFELAKPGVSLRQLQKAVVEFYTKELPKHGLLKPVSEYYFHGVSHQLGLDTHDFADGHDSVLKEGMVITNEPGLYIEDESIGIRIEDDLLITKDGNINLSKEIIKSVEEIENFMKKN